MAKNQPPKSIKIKNTFLEKLPGHELLTVLTLNQIKQELRNFVRNHFQACINEENRAEIWAAWENLCENQVLASCLANLNVSVEAQDGFVKHLSHKYREQFDEAPEFLAHIKESFEINATYQAHAVRFFTVTGLESLLKPSTKITTEAPPSNPANEMLAGMQTPSLRDDKQEEQFSPSPH